MVCCRVNTTPTGPLLGGVRTGVRGAEGRKEDTERESDSTSAAEERDRERARARETMRRDKGRMKARGGEREKRETEKEKNEREEAAVLMSQLTDSDWEEFMARCRGVVENSKEW